MQKNRQSALRALAGTGLVVFLSLGATACGGDDASASADDMVEANNLAAAADVAPATDNPCAAVHDDGGETTAQELPEGVTPAMVDEGKAIFEGAGICSSCHGPAGAGVPNLGADLTDDEWTHIDGSYEEIVANVMNGVTAEASTSGVPMPPKGGTNITDDQVKAVSAYVWTLSRS
ncbi:MAG: cytochrome c [Gemmatimonadota bacterium]